VLACGSKKTYNQGLYCDLLIIMSLSNPDSQLQLIKRPRRLRRNPSIRSLVQETKLTVDDLIYPMFVMEGENERVIPSTYSSRKSPRFIVWGSKRLPYSPLSPMPRKTIQVPKATTQQD
jgi:Delta-aminolevulinic acid dehydratase